MNTMIRSRRNRRSRFRGREIPTDQQKELAFEKRRLEALFKHSMDGIALLDAQDRIIDINQSFTNLFGHHIDEIKGRHIDDILAGGFKYDEAKELTDQVLRGEAVISESTRLTKDGNAIEVSIKGVPIIIENEIMGIFALYSDITSRKKYEERLKHLGMYDSLTGLFNRGFFEDSLSNLNIKSNLPLSIIMADINGLKLINDTFGHAVGDELLIKISEVLKKVCRSGDVVCRIGGDEFAMIFPKTIEADAHIIANRIIKACSLKKIQCIPLSMSLGVATKSEGDQHIQVVLREAEERMYKSKLDNSKTQKNKLLLSLQNHLYNNSHETLDHTKRMKDMALIMGKRLELSEEDLDNLGLLCDLHDIGKVAVSNDILLKEEPLAKEEWDIIKTHPEVGYRISMAIPELIPIAKKILSHHEKWDGTGYPQKIRGEEIPLESRILSIVDAFDVMVTGRPYKKPINIQGALDELERCAGTQFDPRLVKLFIEIIKKG